MSVDGSTVEETENTTGNKSGPKEGTLEGPSETLAAEIKDEEKKNYTWSWEEDFGPRFATLFEDVSGDLSRYSDEAAKILGNRNMILPVPDTEFGRVPQIWVYRDGEMVVYKLDKERAGEILQKTKRQTGEDDTSYQNRMEVIINLELDGDTQNIRREPVESFAAKTAKAVKEQSITAATDKEAPITSGSGEQDAA